MNRRVPVAVACVFGLAVLAGGAVALVTRDGRTASLAPVAGDGAPYVAAETTPAPTDDPTPSPTYSYVLTSPAPNTRQGLAATPDPPRPAHYALPTGCLSFSNACAYDGATGAATGGADDFHVRVTGAASVRVWWTTLNVTPHRAWSTPTEFVVSAYLLPYDHEVGPRDPSRLRRVRLPVTTFAWTFDGLVAGGYEFWVQELNSSGLSSGLGSDPVLLPRPPTPTPKRTPTPTPSASPSPTATPSASATP